jgi:hypothetical protein
VKVNFKADPFQIDDSKPTIIRGSTLRQRG